MAKAASKKKTPAKRSLTKTQIIANIAEATELSKKEVSAVFDALMDEIAKSLGPKGPGTFTLPPGLIKITKKNVPAKPEREVFNPRTGQKQMAPPKPASVTVRARALKKLKELAPKK